MVHRYSLASLVKHMAQAHDTSTWHKHTQEIWPIQQWKIWTQGNRQLIEGVSVKASRILVSETRKTISDWTWHEPQVASLQLGVRTVLRFSFRSDWRLKRRLLEVSLSRRFRWGGKNVLKSGSYEAQSCFVFFPFIQNEKEIHTREEPMVLGYDDKRYSKICIIIIFSKMFKYHAVTGIIRVSWSISVLSFSCNIKGEQILSLFLLSN